MLVVSHDRYFLDRVCDQIVAFEDGGVLVQPGNYSYYLEKKKERDAARNTWSAPKSAAPTPSSGGSKGSRPRKRTFKEQRELEGMEQAILEAETRVHALEALLNDPDFYAERASEAPSVIRELDEKRLLVTRLYARWEELEKIGN